MSRELELPLRRRAVDFVRRAVSKALEDRIFYMAGAITFNVLIAVVPLILLIVGVSGYVLQARFAEPSEVVLAFLFEVLPALEGELDLAQGMRSFVNGLVADRAGLSLVGAVIFLWIGARLVWTLRVSLAEVFDVAQERGFLQGLLFDAGIVVAGGVLVVVNFGVTVLVQSAGLRGIDLLGVRGWLLELLRRSLGLGIAFSSIWVLFFLIYRYLPDRPIPWRTAGVAATFTAVLHELMKKGFGWYAVNFADFGSGYGNLATVAVLFFWIYYGSVVFILGGEVAQIYTMRRTHRIRARSREPEPGVELPGAGAKGE